MYKVNTLNYGRYLILNFVQSVLTLYFAVSCKLKGTTKTKDNKWTN